MFTAAGLGEESVERIIPASQGEVTWHLAIGLNGVLQTVQFPAGIADLHTSLANMNGDDFTHDD